MNKKVLSLGTIVALCFLPAIASFATTGSLAVPSWTTCTGSKPHGNIQISANIGASSVLVIWNAPNTDWEKNLSGGCVAVYLQSITMQVYVNHPSLIPVPATDVCSSWACSAYFNLRVNVFFGKGYITEPYHLQYGDTVTAEDWVLYQSGQEYFGAYNMGVTS